MKRILRRLGYSILCCAVIVGTSGCNNKGEVKVEKLDRREQLCYEFVTEQLIKNDYQIQTNYLEQDHKVEWAKGSEVLSESQGLGMQYFVEIGDQQSYRNLLKFVKKYMDHPQGLSYRYRPDNAYVWHMNALIDDLRIIDSLLEAGKVFEDKRFISLANKWSQRLYETNVIEERVYDFYDWELDKCNEFITLCYVDLGTLDKMSAYDLRWQVIGDKMLPILQGGYISDNFPMFRTRYNYQTQQYEVGESINMVESTLTALHLARMGCVPETTIQFLKEQVAQGRLYAYYSLEGEPTMDMQSTAIYAICALIAHEIGDEVFYEQSINQMNKWQVLNPKSEIYGSFGNEETLEVYAFDNLMALLAYRKG